MIMSDIQSEIDDFRAERESKIKELEGKLGADHPDVLKARQALEKAAKAYGNALISFESDDPDKSSESQKSPGENWWSRFLRWVGLGK